MNTPHQLPSILLPWSNIDTVFLDMDGTLLDLHFDNHFWLTFIPQCYAEANQLPLSEAKAYLTQQTKRLEGQLNWYSLDYWSDQLQLDIAALKHQMAHKIAVRGNSIPFLQWLASTGKRIVLLTNAQIKTIDIKFQYVDLSPYFDCIISSHTLELAKEEKGFWEKLESIEMFNPERSLFIDDNVSVLNTAKCYGVRYLLTIEQPDSQQPAKTIENYPNVRCFSQLMKA